MASPFNPNNLVRSVDPLLSPADLKKFDPLLPQQEKLVASFRKTIRDILGGTDARLLAVVGPCSIHDVVGADDYARRLSALAHELSESLFVVMRVYFEKPRGASEWSGFLTDPHLDGNFRVEDGLKASRKFLHHLVRMELPAGTEALDPFLPAYLGDMFSWMAIGQRASESNAHRMIASGLPVPVGFKNGRHEDGLRTAAEAIRAASRPHDYLGFADDGRLSVFHTCGNDYAHLVLRGSDESSNYGSSAVSKAEEELDRAGQPQRIIVDCSHGNSHYDPARQGDVLHDVLAQIENGNSSIVGFMLESYLGWGNQPVHPGRGELRPGVSVTDPCIDWDTTETLLREAAERFAKVRADMGL
ncbi:MAG: 3-deoxy-7-phosphoheptulonate synthase [Kiritimatiellae bacterium]|nr:3-deoxy-7-phosphoheptulonate synthase [Kiritimatiellia bacterium]